MRIEKVYVSNRFLIWFNLVGLENISKSKSQSAVIVMGIVGESGKFKLVGKFI